MTPFIVWKHFPDDHWTSTAGEPIPSTLWASGMTYAGMACQRICDVDNDTFNEVIATGNNQRLMVWKYNNGAYEMVSWSPELIASMAYGLDCGDLNGDGSAEVVMDLWGAKKYPARLVVLANDATGWPVKNSYSTNYGDQRDLRMGDLDGDGLPEVVMNNHGTPAGLKIFKFIGSSLSSGTFQEVYAAPGYGYGKAEIR
jgi:hypothetical protein